MIVRPPVFRGLLAVLALCLAMTGMDGVAAQTLTATDSAPGLRAFRSEGELRRFLLARQGARPRYMYAPGEATADAAASAEMAVPAPPPASMGAVDEIVVTAARMADPSITNTQVAGVDEGGIVKVRGDYLVILRRGRLFTVSTADGGLRPVDAIDAYAPGVDGGDGWYDEMLISGDRIIVIGFSYGRGGTEVNRFRIGADGDLTFEDAWHLTSNDYYSSRNYASRLIGDQLILYTPLELGWSEDPLDGLPGLRRWTGDEEAAFRRIVQPRDIYMTPTLRRRPDEVDTLHTVTRCDLGAREMTCEATGVLGPSSRNFHVAQDAVYLWTIEEGDPDRDEGAVPASVYRIPLDGGRPRAVRTRGAPIDQFSFMEDRRAGVLNVLVQSEGDGEGMWRSETGRGDTALLRLPLSSFGDGSGEAPARAYRGLPDLPEDGWDRHNRFVGDHLLYAGDRYVDGDYRDRRGVLVVTPIVGGRPQVFELDQPVSRIDILGRDALVVTSEENVVFTTVVLGRESRLADRYVLPQAREGESRSHGFFYRPDPDSPDGARGIMGLPVIRDTPRRDDLFWSATDMTFMRRADGRLTPLGALSSRPDLAVDDGCVASCVDWYGDARPIFLRGRIFALLGYELVEGREEGGAVREVGRVDYSPRARPAH